MCLGGGGGTRYISVGRSANQRVLFSESGIIVSKGAKIRNRVPHLTQDTIGKVTNSQMDLIIWEVNPNIPASNGDG